VRKLDDIKQEAEAPPSKTGRLWIVGLLGVGVFMGLVWFFRTPEEVNLPEDSGFAPMDLSPPEIPIATPPLIDPQGVPPQVGPPPMGTEPSPVEPPVFETLHEKRVERPQEESKAVSVEKRARTPLQKKSSKTGDGVYTIQVASFSQSDRAKALAGMLTKKGLDAYVVASEVPSKGKMYRVRIGHFQSRAAAYETAQRLQRADGTPFFITTTGP